MSTHIADETTKIYSKDNIILAELHEEENRILIPIERISPHLQQAVIAMEDTNFYKHHGLDFKGILRALYKDIKEGRFVEGGSTLTQQLARNLYLYKQKRITRKLAEAILALQIERQYTKTEIFEMYLNQVYWGHNAYGIESASQLYFGKTSADLTIAESALLVGILKGPELYSPFKRFDLAKERQKVVLNRIAKLGIISKETAEASYLEEIVLSPRKKHRYKAPFFTSYIVNQLIEMYGEKSTFTSGMVVRTSLNYELQQHAKKVVEKAIEDGKKQYSIKGRKVPSLNFTQAAILALDPRTGYINVLQGGVDFRENQFNRATQAKRQAGSTFKPFVYLTALERGFSPGTIIEDSPVTFNTIEGLYSPQNYTKKYLGNIPMRKALEKSVNVVAIKINDMVSPRSVVRTAKKIGIISPLKPILSLPLGAMEVTMLELVSAFGVFANQGIRVEPTGIISIEDRNGIPLYKHSIKEQVVFEQNLIATLVEMMRGVVDYGTGRLAKLPRPMAGKTGTTSDYRDAWFIGLLPQLVCGTWVGNDDNAPMINVTGGWFPALMWRDFMKVAVKDIPPQEFPRPKNLVQKKINWDTGLLASEVSPQDRVTIEKYWRGSEPTQADTSETVRKTSANQQESPDPEAQINDFFDFN